MNKEEFLTKIGDILQYEVDKLNLNTNLLDLEEWDSISKISTIAFFDSELGKKITSENLNNVKNISDLIKMAGIDE